MDEGRIDEDTLKSIGQEKEWLFDNLRWLGYERAEQLFYCEWIPDKGFYVEAYQDEFSKDTKLAG